MSRYKEIITTTCNYDCGARCPLDVHIKDGKVVRISPASVKGLEIKACRKGLQQHDVAYSQERIKKPLLRTGKKGEGKFREISWEEAIERIADKIQNTIENYGTESIYFLVNTGSLSTLHNTRAATARFFGLIGKCTTFYCNVSCEAAMQSSIATFGTVFTGSTRDNLLYSKLIILWGFNPAVCRFGSDTEAYLKKAKRKGVQIICVDPRKNKSASQLADKWIAIKPGTDAAMLIAMANVMIKENIYDKDFVNKYCSGFEKFIAYVTGEEDGIVKNPEWAAGICGCSSEDITSLARMYSEMKPAAMMTGWAPGRSIFGEQFHRAASVLSAMTGNVGIRGGFASGGSDFVNIGMPDEKLPAGFTGHNIINKTDLYDAILKGKSGNYPSDCRLLYITGSNLLNQFLNLNKGIKALKKPDFTVIHELFITPTARFADIILPVGHFFDNEDLGYPWIGGPYLIYMNKVTVSGPSYKSDFHIFSELAQKLGFKEYNYKKDERWLEDILAGNDGFPGISALRKKGIYKFNRERPHIAFKEQIEDIDKNPFNTPSGKIEIFSKSFAEKNDPFLPAIPKYIPAENIVYDTDQFPLRLVSPHSPARVNSMFYNLESFKNMEDDFLWINPADAKARELSDGVEVLVFNNMGKIRTRAKITEGILAGCASLDQGRWYTPDKNGVDNGGCVNVLTADIKSPLGAFASNTCYVQVKKA